MSSTRTMDLSDLPSVSYSIIENATNNWLDTNIIGRGGFGIVYKGELDKKIVAIKKLRTFSNTNKDSTCNISTEVILRKIFHKNIVKLLTISTDISPCVVYEYISNGTLDDKLRSSISLTWPERINVALGIAEGLNYLHTKLQKPIIHGDIKSSNILLDEFLEPKIGDFGLAREVNSKSMIKVSKVVGTISNLPPEYRIKRLLSTKVDIYSFGLLLYELATGLEVYDTRRRPHFLLKHFVEHYLTINMLYMLYDMKGGNLQQCFFNLLLKLGEKCCDDLPQYRPPLHMIVGILDPSKGSKLRLANNIHDMIL